MAPSSFVPSINDGTDSFKGKIISAKCITPGVIPGTVGKQNITLNTF